MDAPANETYDARAFRIVVVGVGGVGKSCLTLQYISEKFVEEYDPTLEDSYRKHVNISGEECVLDIFDTAGQEDFSAVRDQYMRTGDGFLVVFSVTLRSSFDEIPAFHEHILQVKDVDNVPMVLVGNKADLVEERVVTTEEGRALAEKLGCKFFETSAKENKNVGYAFDAIVSEIKAYRAAEAEPATPEPKTKQKSKRRGCALF
ncbi:putative transforming protein Ras-1 [Balamuthia mandrillaris]